MARPYVGLSREKRGGLPHSRCPSYYLTDLAIDSRFCRLFGEGRSQRTRVPLPKAVLVVL